MRNSQPSTFLWLVFLIAILGGPLATQAASGGGVISGTVRDPHGAPLAGVAVSLLQGPFNPKIVQTVTTDGTGRFEIKGLLPGLYSLQANLAAYLPVIKSGIGVASGKIAELSLILQNLYLQSVLGSSSADGREIVKEDIESVLRAASSTRPILRVFDTGSGEDEEEMRSTFSCRSSVRGVIGFSTAAFAAAPELASAGTSFTDFAFVKDLNASTTWAVAGVVSDTGFAEVDSLVRFREDDRHNTSVRLSVGVLPYLSDLLTPLREQNVRRLNMYNLDLQDEIRLSEILSVIYGAELQVTEPTTGGARFRPRWGVKLQPWTGRGFTLLRTSSLPQMKRTLALGEDDSLELTSPFRHEFGNRLNFGVNRLTHTEASTDQTLGMNSKLVLGVYSDDFSASSTMIRGSLGARPLKTSRGVRVSLNRSLTRNIEGTVGYTYGSGIQASRDFAELKSRNFHVVAARMQSEIPFTHTQFAATYRWIAGDSITIIDPYQDTFDSASPGISLMFIQAIPYFGRFIPGKLEAQLDVRNFFAKNSSDLYQSASLRRVEFLQQARSVRGGIKLKF